MAVRGIARLGRVTRVRAGCSLFSKHPIRLKFHLNDLLWKDVEGAKMPLDRDSNAFPSMQARELQKLVSQGLWVIEIQVEDTKPVTLALFQNQTPVFDGPEDLNGLRNRAQLVLLSAVMDGTYGDFPKARFVLMGNANLDPDKGEGGSQCDCRFAGGQARARRETRK